MPEQPTPDRDPIVTKSYALYYTVAIALLMVTLFWALWDEAYGQRPWKAFQHEWKDRYSAFLKTARTKSDQSEKEIQQNSEYRELQQDVQQADQASKTQREQIQKQLNDLNARLLAVQSVFTDRRAYVNAITYRIETDTSPSGKKSKQRSLDKFKSETATVKYPDGHKEDYNFPQLEEKYNGLRNERTKLSAELGEVLKPVTEARTKADQYISDHMVDLTPVQIDGLRKKTEELDPSIMQINVAEANIVDRCESCHMGAREPLVITAAAMTPKGQKRPDDYAEAFVSHPEPELLKIHDPEKFGCSTCHQGNGRATTSIEKAHGNYEHWLWPLFPKPNVEAGCQNCHAADMVLVSGDVGSVIGEGKDLFRQRGCMGCHRYEGYDREPEDLNSLSQQIKQADQQRIDNLKQASYLMKQADAASSNEEANRLNEKAVALRVANSKLDGEVQQYDFQSHSLMQDMKKIGPNLKDVRVKLNRNWIPVWLHKPTDFRPTTKMPNFRLNEEQIRSISAYIWQAGLVDPLPQQKPGNADHGKELFETRGCLACHSIGEGSQTQGGTFAANLSRVGEKANFDYLVRWIHNARERTRPYCPYEKKDIGPEDYAKKGLPYVFDLEHSRCPNDGHELQVQNMTVMPSLRLSPDDARDIASYLITQKKEEPSAYADASYMEDPKLKAAGEKWIRHFGCAGCHEIAGFESEGRIGTELTAEGSKPIERLDFALFTEPAKRGGKGSEPITNPEDLARLPGGPARDSWYDHKGFFEHKLAEPEVYDKGKMHSTEEEKLRMPNLHLDKEQIRALTTLLLGSEETSLPVTYQYKPGDSRRDVQEGWWIVKKYNCMGCHQFIPGQSTILMGMSQYQEVQEQLPPKLLTEGARVDPEWLRRFLSNPALQTRDTNRNGVRPYLKVRMPTFSFSDNELRKLVRFFQALSQQPMPYIPEQVPTLTAKETDMARSLFSSTAAPCLKCHATGDAQHDKIATAPNFLLARERLKPDWVERWIVDPQAMAPGTSMPSGLFRRENDHWVFSGPVPPSFNGFTGDHTKLLVDYIFQLTPEEQRRVSSAMGRTRAAVQSGTKHKRAAATSPTTSGGGSR